MNPNDPPRPTGKPPTVLMSKALDGRIFAWRDGAPVLLNMPGTDAQYLAAFTTRARLEALYERACVPFDRIKVIDDGAEFLASLHESDPALVVILDPYFTEEGRVRFVQVQSASDS